MPLSRLSVFCNALAKLETNPELLQKLFSETHPLTPHTPLYIYNLLSLNSPSGAPRPPASPAVTIETPPCSRSLWTPAASPLPGDTPLCFHPRNLQPRSGPTTAASPLPGDNPRRDLIHRAAKRPPFLLSFPKPNGPDPARAARRLPRPA